MSRYLIASHHAWGASVWAQLVEAHPEHTWTLVAKPADLVCALRRERPRYVFVLHWSDKIPSDLLACAEFVNVHCTALPYGRGGHPIENLLQRGHTSTILTAHRMTDEIDAGPIYGTRGPIALSGHKDQILNRCIAPALDMIRWMIQAEPEPVPQVGPVVSFKRFTPAEYTEFWSVRL